MVFSQNNVTSIIIKDKEYNIQSISFMGTEAEWNTNSDYIPKAGELVIYTPDEKISSYRLKIGDGTKRIVELTLNYIETAAEREELLRIIENHTNRIESTAKDITDLKEEFREIKNSFDEVVVEKEEIQAVVEEHTNKIENVTKDVVDLKQDFLDSENNFNNALSEKADTIQHAEGKLITLDNAGYTPVKGLKLYGKTTQFTTTGKNLYSGGDVVVPNAWQGYQVINFPVDAEFPKFTLSFNPNGFVGSLVCLVQDAKNLVLSGTESRVSLVITPQRSHSSNNLLYNNNEERSINFTDIQIELGNTATAYEPYTGGIPAPNPDYPQELVSAGASGAINTTVAGKNLLAEPFVFGVFSTGGHNAGNTTVTSTHGFFLKAGTYVISDNLNIKRNLFIHSMKNKYYADSGQLSLGSVKRTFTLPKDGMYNIQFNTVDGVNYTEAQLQELNNSAQLELGDTPTAFEPYKAPQILTASTPNGLPGIPVTSGGNYTDENGQQWICDEIDFARGEYTKRIGKLIMDGNSVIFTGQSQSTKSYLYTTRVSDAYLPNYSERKANTILCSHGASISHTDAFNGAVGATAYKGEGSTLRYSFGLNADFDTREKTKEWLKNQYNNGTPLTFMYVLAEPIATALSDEELTAYAALHTNKPNTTVYNDANAYMEMDYYTPTTAVQMVHSPADEGKVLSIDQHGCVVLTDLATRIAQIESQLAYMAIITNNEEMLEV